MRKLILFLLPLLVFPLVSFGQEHLSSIYTNTVFADLCNIREAPSLSAKIIGQVPHRTSVEICSPQNQSTSDTINGIVNYWVPVKFENRIGYLWNPLLAKGHFRSHLNTDIEFLIHFIPNNELEIKVFKQNELFVHKTFKRTNIHHLTGSTTLGKTFNSKGNEVIVIAFNDSLYELFEWNGADLKASLLKLNDESFITGKYTEYPYGFIKSDKVRLRAAPDSGAAVVATLPSLSKLLIAEPDSVSENMWNYKGFWQKVRWENSFAYVWSDYLDIPVCYIKSNKKENEAFLYTSGGIYVLQDDKLIFHLPTEGYSTFRNRNLVNFGSRGLDEKFQFLSVCVYANSCGQSSGDMLYVWDGSKLKFLYFDGGIGDGGIVDYFSLTFPADMGGMKDRLIKYDAYSEPDNLVLDISCESYGSAFMSEIYSIMEFKGDTLVEVASKHLQVKQLAKLNYPDYPLMHYRFFDGNRDGLEDVVFFLYYSNYEMPNLDKAIIGIAYGTADGTYEQLVVNENMVKTGFFSVQYSTTQDTLEMIIKYNTGLYNQEDKNSSYSRYKFGYDQELKAMVWRSLTTAETFRPGDPVYMNDPKTEYFKTNRIRFENAW